MDEQSFRRRSHRGSNGFQSGYVPVDEEYLQHSGIRGKRSWCLCALLIVLLLVAVVNALVTVGLVYFMSVTHEGMMSLEFLPGGRFLRSLLDVYVDRVKINSGVIGGRAGKQFIVDSRKLMLNQSIDASVFLDDTGTVIKAKEFRLLTSQWKELFSPRNPSVVSPSYEAINLHAAEIGCGSISSNKHVPDLHLKSYHDLTMLGMEGIHITTEGDLDLKAKQITIEAVEVMGIKSQEGVFLHPNLPIRDKDMKNAEVNGQLKVCVCMPSGKLFTVPVTDSDSGCHRANEDANPCHS